MAKQRKPFVSRKRRKEMDEARAKRETFALQQEEQRKLNDTVVAPSVKASIELPSILTVAEFAVALNLPVTKVITSLVRNGIMAAINDRVDFDTMAIVADELGYEARETTTEIQGTDNNLDLPTTTTVPITEGSESRPPIVTIMGHVDHGKTSLLDYIRNTSVASGEAGGITQHIGAYQTHVPFEGKERLITFLDTPGHEAFTALRSHGAQVTDIVVLVVAADDGIKPQTIEVIRHAKTAGVPIIVAVNKIDLPGANLERVKQQLTEHELIPEEWGGSTLIAPVSAKTGQGVQELLEYILLTADLKNYRADSLKAAQGVVIESHHAMGLGAVATLLIQTGTLNSGDILVIGATHGKVRSMTDFNGNRISTAGPSMPVQISGLQSIPHFGDSFVSVKTEKEARALTESVEVNPIRSGIESISKAIAEGKANAFNIILKADAQGSLEALKHSINAIQVPGVKIHVIHSGIGEITLNDIQLSQAGNAVIFGFNTPLPASVKKAAEQASVPVSVFTIIYELLNQIELIIKGKVKIKTVRVEKGRLKIKKVFRTTRDTAIVGGEITQGSVFKNAIVSVARNQEMIGEGRVKAVQKGPEEVDLLESGQDCGVSLAIQVKLQEGDIITFMEEQEIVAEDESLND